MRGRPARIANPVDIHVRVPGDLLDAAKRSAGSDAEAVRKGLCLLIRHDQPESMEALGIRIRELKKSIARDTGELSKIRERLVKMGVEDLDEFESNYMGDC